MSIGVLVEDVVHGRADSSLLWIVPGLLQLVVAVWLLDVATRHELASWPRRTRHPASRPLVASGVGLLVASAGEYGNPGTTAVALGAAACVLASAVRGSLAIVGRSLALFAALLLAARLLGALPG